MAKQKIEPTDHYDLVIQAMTTHGLLLGSYDSAGKPNAMTIGWGGICHIWGIPVWTVLVRPSRYTYRCIEHTTAFSVNVPTDSMVLACAGCGSKSGRDVDKFAEFGLEAVKGTRVLAPTIGQCPITYECQVIHSTEVLPEKLQNDILSGSYVDGDFHRIYFGKILHAQAEPNAAELLSQ